MTTYVQVITTVAEKDQAQNIARSLLEKGLAACVQIDTCESMYRWQGEVEQDLEYRCTIKSKLNLYPEVEKTLANIHPYDVPEIIVVPIIEGGSSYLDWMENELKENSSP